MKARIDGVEPGDTTWPADGYQGDYIKDVATAYQNKQTVNAADRTVTASGDAADVANIQAFSVAWLRREQDEDLKAFDVNFDCYFLESSLYTSNAVEKTVETLIDNQFTYEQDDALWLRTTDFGDDKDRVMQSARVATPTLFPMWRTTTTSGTEVSSALLMSRELTITAPSLASGRGYRV